MNNLGKKAYFSIPHISFDRVLSFSSSIENIGKLHDCKMKNHTKVIIISEEEMAIHPLLGEVKIVKVFAGEEMWLPADSLTIIDEPITNN